LEILQGTITGAQPQNGQYVISYRHSYTWQTEQVLASKVINCTGPATDYINTGNALFTDLLEKGWLQTDVHHLGIVTGEKGEIIQPDGNFLPGVYAIGPLRKASEWESTAIPEIRKQAQELARLLIASRYPVLQTTPAAVLCSR